MCARWEFKCAIRCIRKAGTVPAASEGVERPRHRLPHGRGSVALCKHATFFPGRDLFEFGAAGVGRLGGPILVDSHALIHKECPAPAAVVGFRVHIQRITRRRGGHGENVAVLIAACQAARNQVGGLWSGASAGRWSKLGQRGGVSSELGHVLGLHAGDCLYFTQDRHFIRVHLGAAQFGNSDGKNDQDDRDDDQKLDERKAARAAPTETGLPHDINYDGKRGRNVELRFSFLVSR
jgi:hypothetical protein